MKLIIINKRNRSVYKLFWLEMVVFRGEVLNINTINSLFPSS